jgi:rod shape-determining protein MreC
MTERRTRALFILALVGQLLVLTTQVPDPNRRGSVLESLGLRLFAPLSQAIDAGVDGAAGLGTRWRGRGELLAENERLRRDLDAVKLEVMRLQDLEDETRRLAAALDYARATPERLEVADVVYVDHASWLRTLVVHGRPGRLRLDQPVIAAQGLVGRVVAVAGGYAKVQLVTDRAASVGAMLETTRRQGVVRGDGTGGLEMDYVPLQAPVEVGERVLTGGIDLVFPRGIPVGVVRSAEGGGELFHRIRLTPAVDFGRLDQVYVLDRPPLPTGLREAPQVARP